MEQLVQEMAVLVPKGLVQAQLGPEGCPGRGGGAAAQ